ncbi:MAG: hypothetical protein CVV23_07465 [Ignavibacteriae bacterium HGW-Ignavibacteriae-2]|jgi:nucleoside-diphosphate-sugar epimerase|nr:MAG: hypothetical protein CVV23_07465 [Ignavibacteriae bacterium HGW-Ignavibacteriae-2]
MRPTCLVVGATGGIGRSVVKYLLEEDCNVKVLVRDKEKAGKYFSQFAEVEIIFGDAANKTDVARAAEETTHLFYCLNIPYPDWNKKARELLKISVDAAKTNEAKFVFPGNVYVYGHAESNPVNENHPHKAHTSKGKIRIEMEELIKSSGVNWTIIRFPDFYGPYVVNGFSEMLYLNSLSGKPLKWIGETNLPIEYIYIEDAGNAMVVAGLSSKSDKQEYNVPANEKVSNKEYLTKISKLGGKNSGQQIFNSPLLFKLLGIFNKQIKEVDEMMYLKREELFLDGTKFLNTFGFLPSTTIDDGINKTFDWVKSFYRIN